MWQVMQMKYTYSLRSSGGGRESLLTLLFQQHGMKGCERVLDVHWVSLTGVDTGAPHLRLTRVRQMWEGNICTSVTPSVIKGWACCRASKDGTASESYENKFMWKSGRYLRFRGQRWGLSTETKACARESTSARNETQMYIWFLQHETRTVTCSQRL